jgi:uncharacterized membrane protein YjjP (DUF1212 family)
MLGFGIVASVIIFSASYYARKLRWDYKFAVSLALSISFAVIVLAVWAMTGNLKYLVIGIILSLLQGVSMYIWLRYKKIN